MRLPVPVRHPRALLVLAAFSAVLLLPSAASAAFSTRVASCERPQPSQDPSFHCADGTFTASRFLVTRRALGVSGTFKGSTLRNTPDGTGFIFTSVTARMVLPVSLIGPIATTAEGCEWVMELRGGPYDLNGNAEFLDSVGYMHGPDFFTFPRRSAGCLLGKLPPLGQVMVLNHLLL